MSLAQRHERTMPLPQALTGGFLHCEAPPGLRRRSVDSTVFSRSWLGFSNPIHIVAITFTAQGGWICKDRISRAGRANGRAAAHERRFARTAVPLETGPRQGWTSLPPSRLRIQTIIRFARRSAPRCVAGPPRAQPAITEDAITLSGSWRAARSPCLKRKGHEGTPRNGLTTSTTTSGRGEADRHMLRFRRPLAALDGGGAAREELTRAMENAVKRRSRLLRSYSQSLTKLTVELAGLPAPTCRRAPLRRVRRFTRLAGAVPRRRNLDGLLRRSC